MCVCVWGRRFAPTPGLLPPHPHAYAHSDSDSCAHGAPHMRVGDDVWVFYVNFKVEEEEALVYLYVALVHRLLLLCHENKNRNREQGFGCFLFLGGNTSR